MGARLAVLGGGRMGEALVAGLVASGRVDPSEVTVVERDAARREQWANSDGVLARIPVVADLEAAELSPGFGAVLAVKPADIDVACAALIDGAPARVLSIAAGITLATLESLLHESSDSGSEGAKRPPVVLRAMPNTPSLVGAGAAGLSAGAGAGADDITWAEEILSAVGLVTKVPESYLNAITGLSGSGPAYVFLIAEALIDAGVLVGLPRAMAEALTAQTLLGAARMLSESGEGPLALRAAVTSPGGTTAAGLRAMEAGGVRAAMIDAVVASAERSAQLG